MEGLVDPDQVDQNMVNIQVRDLDGWQQSRSVLIGQQTIISATQGFGRKKKFKRWVEFAEEDKILRTARVESPFSLRSALFAEENMTLFAFYNSTFSGTAINGYLNGSTVFLDFNFNGRQDEGEPSGFFPQVMELSKLKSRMKRFCCMIKTRMGCSMQMRECLWYSEVWTMRASCL